MPGELSSEERLLRLIKGTTKKPKKQPEPVSKKAELTKPEKEEKGEKPITKPSLQAAVSSKITALPKGAALAIKRQGPFKMMVIALSVFLFLTFAFLVYEVFSRREQPAMLDIESMIAEEEQLESEQKAEQAKAKDIAAKKPVEEITDRDRLDALFGAPVPSEAEPIEVVGPTASELSRGLVLLGIISGENPQAIIQDKKTNQSFYVSEGDSVLMFKVQSIKSGNVILDYKGETVKLTL